MRFPTQMDAKGDHDNGVELVQPMFTNVFHKFPEWVWDFLLNKDGAADTEALTSPIRSQHATLLVMSNVTHCMEQNMPGPSFGSNFVVVPSFSIDGITVGLVTEEFMDGYEVVYQGVYTRRVSRFAFCENTAFSLTVNIDVRNDVIDFLDFSYLTMAMRRRTLLRFCYSEFCAIRPKFIHNIDLSALQTALRMVSSAREQRKCPACAAPENTWCTCTIKSLRPRHPLDFERIMHNTLQQSGVYSGTISVNLYANGELLYAARLLSNLSNNVGGEPAPGTKSKLIKWAIQDRMESSRLSPGSCEVSSHAYLTRIHSPQLEYDADVYTDSDQGMPVSPQPTRSQSPAEQPEGDVLNLTATSDEQPQLTGPLADWKDIESLLVSQPPDAKVTTSTPLERAGVQESVPPTSGAVPTIRAPSAKAEIPDAIPVADCEMTPISPETSQRAPTQPQWVPIAPLPQPEARQEQAPEETSEKEKRRLARKLRNREAAARSNLKRRLRNEELKRQREAEAEALKKPT